MKYTKEPSGEKLIWIQPKPMVRYHELRVDGAIYATLKWKRMFGSLATGECREDRYTFKRAGFLRPYITVRRENAQGDLAILRFRSGSIIVNSVIGLSGTLEFETGHRYSFNRLSFWKSRWAFSDENGDIVVTFDRNMRGKPKATVTIHRDFRRIQYLDILLILGWYAIILDYEEGEASAGTGQMAAPSNG